MSDGYWPARGRREDFSRCGNLRSMPGPQGLHDRRSSAMNVPPHLAPCLEVGEAQFRAILDAIPARVALLDRERRHCYANREYAAFVDRRPEELLGHTVPELF